MKQRHWGMAIATVLLTSILAFFAACPADEAEKNISQQPTVRTITVIQPGDDNSYTVSVDGGAATSSDTQAVQAQTITLIASPTAGFNFDGFTVTKTEDVTVNVNVEEDNTFTMPDADVIITAAFTPNPTPHLITVTQPGNGNSYTVSVDGGTAANSNTQAMQNQTITLVASPAANFRFDGFTVTKTEDVTVNVNVTEDNTFTMPNTDVTITATFTPLYTLTVNQPASGGTFTVSVAGGTPVNGNVQAASGDIITLVAGPAGGFTFTSFTITRTTGGGSVPALSGSGNSRTFAMDPRNLTVTASFTAISTPRAIAVNQAANGTFTVSVAGGAAVNTNTTATSGQVITLAATPSANFTFGSFTVTRTSNGAAVTLNTGSGATRTFNMPDYDVTVTASYTATPRAIAVNQAANGTFTVSVAGGAAVNTNTTATGGQVITLVATPSANFTFGSFTVTRTSNGAAVALNTGSGNTRTFNMPDYDVTVTASYTATVRTITVNQATGGTFTVSVAGGAAGNTSTTATGGQAITLVATPSANYTFGGFTVTPAQTLGGSGTTRTFNMPNQNVTVTATWTFNDPGIPSSRIIENLSEAIGSYTQTGSGWFWGFDATTGGRRALQYSGAGPARTFGRTGLNNNIAPFFGPNASVSVGMHLELDGGAPYTFTVELTANGTAYNAQVTGTQANVFVDYEIPLANFMNGATSITSLTAPVVVSAWRIHSNQAGTVHLRLSGIEIVDSTPSVPRTITVTQPGSGGTYTVSVAGGAAVTGNTTAERNQVITLTATPAANFRFTSFTVTRAGGGGNPALSGTGNVRTFTMPDANVTITATFTQTYNVTLSQPGSGHSFTASVAGGPAVSGNTTTQAAQNDIVTLTAQPAAGFRLVNFTVTRTGGGGNPTTSGTGNSRTFTMPNAAVTITAAFELIPGGAEDIDGVLIGQTVTGKGTLVWGDAFNGTTLDLNKWNIETGGGSQYGISGWGNQEAQSYNANNVIVRNGNLILEGRVQNGNYTSGRITTGQTRATQNGAWTRETYSVRTGLVEARIRSSHGVGFWPAFWLLGSNSYGNIPARTTGPFPRPTQIAQQGWPLCGEIDILEFFGGLEGQLLQTLHYGATFNGENPWRYTSWYTTPNRAGATNSQGNFPGPGYAGDWQVYGVRWDNTRIEFMLNDQVTISRTWAQVDGRAGSNEWMQNFWNEAGFAIILNLAIGGNMASGLPPASAFPGTFPSPTGGGAHQFEVDWVRVYQP
ncbi:MAG: family 16 glycosylhydrolase [Treponema sp.]|nr:family 16 glycosylhydrolase [Treponema sp.]